MAEDGEIAERYPLTPLPPILALVAGDELSARQMAELSRARTLKNVQDSDGTAILFRGSLSSGTLLTQKSCLREKKPFVAIDAQVTTKLGSAETIAQFVEEHCIEVFNVAGPRLSGWPATYRYALSVSEAVISHL